MSNEFLRQVASTPLSKSFTHPEDDDAVKILRQSGLVIATIGEQPERAARVIAVTHKGRDELLRFHHPNHQSAAAVADPPSAYENEAERQGEHDHCDED